MSADHVTRNAKRTVPPPSSGRPADAEQVYREDLRRNPGNGWSLFGLAQSQRAQARMAEAAQTDERFRQAWSRADVTLTASRF